MNTLLEIVIDYNKYLKENHLLTDGTNLFLIHKSRVLKPILIGEDFSAQDVIDKIDIVVSNYGI